MIRVTLEFDNEAELVAYFNKAPVTVSGDVVKPRKEEPAAKKQTAAEPSAPAAAAASTASSTAQETQSTKPAEDKGASGKTYTVEDAKQLTMKIVASKGRDAAVTLLKKFDVPVAAKLPADKVAEFCVEAEGVLA